MYPIKPKTDLNDWIKWKVFVRNFYKSNVISPVLVKKPLDNRPYISITLYDENLIALLDSGANVNCIGSLSLYLLDKYKIKVTKPFKQIIKTADGKSQTVTGIFEVPLYLGNICKLVKFSVVPSLCVGMVLGSCFCKQFSLNINFQNNTWNIINYIDKIEINTVVEVPEQNTESTGINKILSSNQITSLNKVISLFRGISYDDRLGRTSKITAHIETGDAKPFKKRQYPLSPYLLEHLNKQLDKMLALNVVRPSYSAWNSPVLLVKKSSGDYRFCFDGRSLNEITKRDAYPLPRIDDILKMLANAKFMSTLDLSCAFWQIPLNEESKEKTAFSVPGRGLFEFNCLPFGLRNAAQITQRLMDNILGPKFSDKVFCYLDDIVITSSSFEEHLNLLKEVYDRLVDANLTINFNKCQFCRDSLNYLGFTVDSHGLRTSPQKVKAMVEFPKPRTSTQLKRFLGMISWYRRFISSCSSLTAPLNELLKGRKKHQPIKWNVNANRAFNDLKQRLISAPILSAPDFSLEFTIQCDASTLGLGGVLTQIQNGEEKVISYASRSLSRAEKNYSAVELELLSVVHFCEVFRGYIEGSHFKVITDNASLKYLRSMDRPSGRLCRWAARLSMFDFEVIHRKGKLHVTPDALSRAPLPLETNFLGIDLENLEPWYLKLRDKVSKHPEKYSNWMIKDNYLYKHLSDRIPLKTNISEWKLLVPLSQRRTILENNHSISTAAHLGYYKTLHRLKENFYWPRMCKDVLNFVKRCHTCNKQKANNARRFGLMGVQRKVTFPFQLISLDVMGPFPISSKRNRFLIAAQDYFTKYTMLKPVRNATAQNIVSFLEQIFLTYGVPHTILLDNATAHKGKVFQEFVKSYKIPNVFYNLKYFPQSNSVERLNRVVGTAIRSFIKESHKSWDQNIQQIQYAINTSQHEVTGFSPAFLNFGRTLPINGEYYGKNNLDLNLNDSSRSNYADELRKLPEIYSKVQQRLDKAYERAKNFYNLRRQDKVFSVGERVWKRNHVLSDAQKDFSAKLADRYTLCTVKRVISNISYELQDLAGTSLGRWHVSQLKPYFGSNTQLANLYCTT